jgi:hypothetical protein
VTGEFSLTRAYDADIGGAAVNTLNLISILLLILLLPMTLLGSSVEVFFTKDELTEMGVRIDPFEIEGGAAAA